MPGRPRGRGHAAAVRAWPFALFILLLALRGNWPAESSLDGRWIYAVTVLLVGGALVTGWRHFFELGRSQRPTPAEAAGAAVLGLAVFVAWIHLDASWMQIGTPSASFLPLDAQGDIAWAWVAVRWVGATCIVPLMEELFWRSLVMRWIDRSVFLDQPPGQVSAKAVLLSTSVFVLAHTLWLAAIVAGLAYAWIYRRTGKLWTAVIAHAITNGALGAWVVATGRWEFW